MLLMAWAVATRTGVAVRVGMAGSGRGRRHNCTCGCRDSSRYMYRLSSRCGRRCSLMYWRLRGSMSRHMSGQLCRYFIVVLRRIGGERKGEQATHAQDDEQQGDGYE